MFRYKLRTLLIVLGIAPPVLAGVGVWLASDPMQLREAGELLSPLMCLAPFAVVFIAVVIAARIAARRKSN